MKISKTATDNEDGTYTITLEAYATGEKISITAILQLIIQIGAAAIMPKIIIIAIALICIRPEVIGIHVLIHRPQDGG